MALKRVYPDTNTAAHFRRFDEIDWLDRVDADQVVLVVTSQFLKELDRLKYTGATPRIRARAKSVMSWLAPMNGGEQLRAGVTIEFQLKSPGVGFDFTAHDLDRADGDDCHIACVLRDREKDPATPVVFFTGDHGMQKRVRTYGIDVAMPAESDELKEEADPTQKELENTRRQLAKLSDTRADLSLSFVGGQAHKKVVLDLPTKLHVFTGPAIRRRHYVHTQAAQTRRGAVFLKDWDKYHAELEAWMVECQSRDLWNKLGIPLDLELFNDGKGQAKDIEVELRAKAPVVFREEKPKTFPKPPRMWTPKMEHILRDMEFPSIELRNADLEFYEDDPQRVRVQVKDLNHEDRTTLPPVWVAFPRPEDVASFSVEFTVFSATQPSAKRGSLHLDVRSHLKPFEVPDIPDDEDDD